MDIDGLSWSLTSLGDSAQLDRHWTELETRSDCPFFLTWDWIGTWLSTTPGLSPLLLSVYDGSVVVALGLFQPADIRRRMGSRRALMLHRSADPSEDLITIEYNGILTDRHYTGRIESALFAFLAKARDHNGPQWQELHVGLATGSMAERAEASGLIVAELWREPSWFVDLAATRSGDDQYLDTLGPNTRHQIRRAMRIYQRSGPVEARAARSAAEALEFFAELKTLHQQTWTRRGQPGSFASDHFENFHRALLPRCVERGTAEIVRVSAGSRLIGQVYNFIRNGRVYAYQTGFTYESDPKLKPGLVSHFMCVDRHLHDGSMVYDFMAGGGRYKSNLGIRGPQLAYYVFQEKTLISSGMALARRIKNGLLKDSK